MLVAARRWSALYLIACVACGTDDAPPSGSTAGSGSADASGTAETTGGGSQRPTGSGDGSEGTTVPGTEDSDASSGGTGAIDCEQRCAEQGACGEPAEENCLANCVDTQRAADAVGDACGQAYVEFQDCQTQRTCAQIEQESGCEAEVELVMTACAEVAPAACEAVCPKWIECGLLEQQYCVGTCALQIGFARVIAPDCGTAFEALYLCEAELECAELEVDHCPEEQAAGEQACQ